MSTAALTAPTPGTATLRRTLRVEWDRTMAWTLVGAAPVALLWGWQHLAGSPFGAEEVAYLISGGLTGLVLLLTGVAALITADLRDEHYKLERLESAVRGEAGATDAGRWWTARLAAVLVVALGFVAAGWARAAGTGRLEVALDGLVLAAAGPLLAAAGLVGHALAVRRGVVRRRDALLAHVRQALADLPVTEDGLALCSEQLWTAAGLRRLHRRDCAALASAGAPAVAVTEAAADADLCQLCHRGSDARA